MTLRQLKAFAHRHREARAIGPIYRTAPPVIIIVCLLWALLGVLWAPRLVTVTAAPEPEALRIPGALCLYGHAMCERNRGLDELERTAPGRWSAQCTDGAQFPPVRVNVVSQSGAQS